MYKAIIATIAIFASSSFAFAADVSTDFSINASNTQAEESEVLTLTFDAEASIEYDNGVEVELEVTREIEDNQSIFESTLTTTDEVQASIQKTFSLEEIGNGSWTVTPYASLDNTFVDGNADDLSNTIGFTIEGEIKGWDVSIDVSQNNDARTTYRGDVEKSSTQSFGINFSKNF